MCSASKGTHKPHLDTASYRKSTLLLLGITVVLGLASRHVRWIAASFLGKYPGDLLYATMVYWVARLAAPASRKLSSAVIAAAICLGIELLKLWHVAYLDEFRSTAIGRLILGSGFHTLNIICYAAGVGLGLWLDELIETGRRGRAVQGQSYEK